MIEATALNGARPWPRPSTRPTRVRGSRD